MKLCIPASENNGFESRVSHHFGRAPFQLIVDPASRSTRALSKDDKLHGECGPVHAIISCGVQAVVCQGMGTGAAANFECSGIPVFKTNANTVEMAVEAYKKGALPRLTKDDLCAGHHDPH